MDMLNI